MMSPQMHLTNGFSLAFQAFSRLVKCDSSRFVIVLDKTSTCIYEYILFEYMIYYSILFILFGFSRLVKYACVL